MKNLNKIRFKVELEKFFVNDLWQYFVVFASIALCSWIFDRWIQGAMFAVAHIVIRQTFQKQFHLDETAFCVMLTLYIVWFAIPVTLPISISLLSSLPIAFLICFVGYLAQDRVDLIMEKQKRTSVTLENISVEQVVEICNVLHYNKDKRDLAIMFFVDKLSNKQVWEILCNSQRNVEWDTVNKYKYRITKDFKNIINQREQ